MDSVAKWMALAYGITVVIMMTPQSAHSDQVCMVCPSGCGMCSPYTCCRRFSSDRLTTVFVEVNCSHPEQSRIIDSEMVDPKAVQNSSTCTGLYIMHESSCLSAFPENYCKFTATREISMSYNKLTEIPDLKCLFLLGKLNLMHNKLTRLNRDTFKGLKHLQEVFLDFNEISYIHPLAFDELSELSIFSVSYNHLLTLDAWTVSWRHEFCVINVSHNRVEHLSNRGHWKFNMSKEIVYGPGYVDFSYNRFTGNVISELSQFGLESTLQLARYIRWGFDVRHNPIHCDCKLYPAVKWGEKLAHFIWRDYFNVTCGSPPHLRGFPILKLPLEDLVCNVTVDCPPGCYCEDQPHKKTMYVNCDSVGLQSLPDVLPEGRHLVIDMANNSLGVLPPRQYLTRTKRISLRSSGLKVIEKDTPHLLRKVKLVDLRDNELHHLPSTFQVLDPGVVLLDLHTLKCSCDLHWMATWLHHGHNKRLENITCTQKEGDTLLLFNTTRHDLCEKVKVTVYHSNYKILLITSLSALLLVTTVLLVFRHEIVVSGQAWRAQRRLRQRRQSDAFVMSQQFDVFISMNVNSESDTEWVRDVLIPHLDLRGFQSYLPLRDCSPGSVEMDELTKRMQDSATALVVLSPDYVQSPACLFQFKQAYSHMLALRQGNLLVIRRGTQLSRRSVPEPRLRAMLTLRMFCTDDLYQLHKALDKLVIQYEAEVM